MVSPPFFPSHPSSFLLTAFLLEANPPNFAQVLKKYSQTITTLLQNQEKKGKEKEDFSFHIPPEQLSHHLPSECPQNIREELSLVLSRSLKLLALHPGLFSIPILSSLLNFLLTFSFKNEPAEFQQKGKEEVREVIETGFSFSSLQKEDNPTQLFPYCFCILFDFFFFFRPFIILIFSSNRKETLRQFPTKKFPPLRHCPRDTVLGVKKIEKETGSKKKYRKQKERKEKKRKMHSFSYGISH